MATITFDTLALAEKLKAAGFDAAQDNMVTRDYLDARLSENKVDLIKWIAGMLLAQAGLIAALVKLF